MNDTTAEVSRKFQQDLATSKVFHREQLPLYGNYFFKPFMENILQKYTIQSFLNIS